MTTNPTTLYACVPYVPETGVHVRDLAPDPYLLPRPGWPQPEPAEEEKPTDPCPPPELDESGMFEQDPVPVNGSRP